jgi:cell division protein FtsW (lipid II flippase)
MTRLEAIGLKSPGLWLAVSVIIGIAHMVTGGAPPHFMIINAAALGIALVIIRFAPAVDEGRAPVALAAAAIAILIFPLLTGPEVAGASRWIGVGPVTLHSGMLMLPILAALLFRLKPAPQVAVVALAAIAVSLQPDRASAMALLAGTGALAFANRSATRAAQMVLAGLAIWATFAQPDTLQPVRFVENVVSDSWRQNPLVGAILLASLVATLVIPVSGNRRLFPVAAILAGFTFASLIGAYPVPLVGYGASAILGFGLAIAAARQPVP